MKLLCLVWKRGRGEGSLIYPWGGWSSRAFWLDKPRTLRNKLFRRRKVLVDQARVAGLLNDRGEVQRPGKLKSMVPTNLNGNSGRVYFHLDYEVSEYYTAYTMSRAARPSR
jgi:hypothetical protein